MNEFIKYLFILSFFSTASLVFCAQVELLPKQGSWGTVKKLASSSSRSVVPLDLEALKRDPAFQKWKAEYFEEGVPLDVAQNKVFYNLYAQFSSASPEQKEKAFKCLRNHTFSLSLDQQNELVALLSLYSLSLSEKERILEALLAYQSKLWGSLFQEGRENDIVYRHSLYGNIIDQAYERYVTKHMQAAYYKKFPATYAQELASFFA